MGFNKSTAALLTFSLTALLTGCGAQTEKDMLAEAQFCLDKANDATTANACMTKIDGLTSKQSYELRCSAGFIASGIISPSNLSTALNSMKENASTASVLGVLAFDDRDLVNTTFDNCNLSENAGLKLVAAMAKSATVLYSLTNGSGDLETQMVTAISSIVTNLQSGDPALQAAAIARAQDIGGAIQTVYQTSCAVAAANTEMCGSIDGALAATPGVDIASASPEDLGAALLAHWQSTNN